MLAIYLMGALGGAWLAYRAARKALDAVPRTNDDLIFY